MSKKSFNNRELFDSIGFGNFKLIDLTVIADEEVIMTYAEHLRQEGMQQGIEMASLEIAKSLLQAGVDKNIIKQTTHLTDEQLGELFIKQK